MNTNSTVFVIAEKFNECETQLNNSALHMNDENKSKACKWPESYQRKQVLENMHEKTRLVSFLCASKRSSSITAKYDAEDTKKTVIHN